MPNPPNKTLRLFVPLAVLAASLAIGWLVYSGRSTKTPAATPATGTTPTAPAATTTPATTPATTPVTAAATTPGTQAAVPQAAGATPQAPVGAIPAGTMRAKVWDEPGPRGELGSTDPAMAKARVVISDAGVGVKSLMLGGVYTTIKNQDLVSVQSEHRRVHEQGPPDVLAPLAALAVEVSAAGGPAQMVGEMGDPRVWKNTGAGAFEAMIVDGAGAGVLRITRRYELMDKVPGVKLTQAIENLSAAPVTVRWFQVGPVDMDPDGMVPGSGKSAGGFDKRRVRFGYMLPPELDPGRQSVVSDEFVLARSTVLGSRAALHNADGSEMKTSGGAVITGFADSKVWPNKTSDQDKLSLSWVGVTNRYFGAVVLPMPPQGGAAPTRTLAWVKDVTRIVLDAGEGQEMMALRLDSAALPLAPAGAAGAKVDLSQVMYAGPTDKATIRGDAWLASMGVSGLVYYNFGGMCGFCTFSWLTGLLYAVLHALHDWVFHDWSLAIIVLVLLVRGTLHPVTRWSQIRTARFGKQMQAVGPKQKQLQEKWKDDAMRLQQETRKLWAEEGISPAGFLGCLPMFLQSPVWIALYATLYFAFELRQAHGFYGVFQSVQGAGSPFWWFLGDLAEPDRLWNFGRVVVTLPILGAIQSVNVLPILLGVVFFVQQKYLTTAQAAPTTPEQEMQMKMMKWMTVLMFPLVMYNAPSGLAIYFIANSTLGILESKWIRRHMETHGLLDLDKMRAERNIRRAATGRGGAAAAPSGFMAKLAAFAEEQQRRAGQQKPKR